MRKASRFLVRFAAFGAALVCSSLERTPASAQDVKPATPRMDGPALPPSAAWQFAPRRDAHAGPVVALSVAEEGATLVTAGGDGVVRWWNAADGKPLAAIAFAVRFDAVALSSSGREIAWSEQGMVRAAKLPRASEATALPHSTVLAKDEEFVGSVALSWDGRSVAWNGAHGAKRCAFSGGPATSVAPAPDVFGEHAGRCDAAPFQIAVSAGTVFVPQFGGLLAAGANGKPRRVATSTVSAAALSRDETLLAAVEPNGTTTIWRAAELTAATKDPPRPVAHWRSELYPSEELLGAALSADGRILCVQRGAHLLFLETQSGRPFGMLDETAAPSAILVSTAAKRLVVGRADGTAAAWNFEDGRPLGAPTVFGDAKTPGIRSLAATDSDGASVVSASDDGLTNWDRNGAPSLRLAPDDAGRPVAVSPDLKLVVRAKFGDLLICRVVDDHVLWSTHVVEVGRVGFSRDGRRVANSAAGAPVISKPHFQLFDAADGRVLVQFDDAAGLWTEASSLAVVGSGLPAKIVDHDGHVFDGLPPSQFGFLAQASKTGEFVVASRSVLAVELWHPRGEAPIQTLKWPQYLVSDVATWNPTWPLAAPVAFSDDGALVAAGLPDGTVVVWRFDSGTPQQVLRGHAAPIQHVAFLRPHRLLATSDAAGRLVVWNLDDVK